MNMQSLQSMLEEKARKKLDADLVDFRSVLHNYGSVGSMLLELPDVDITISGGKPEGLRSALWSTGSSLFKKVYEKALPQYIEKEVSEFLEKVESMRRDVDRLLQASTDY